MKRCCFLLFMGMMCCCVQLVAAQQAHRKPIVVIDPGHGGTDFGAIGVNGIKEKVVNLKIAMEVLRWNKMLLNDALVIFSTRYVDSLVSLGHRSKLANVLRADVFVSIHCNQAVRKTAQGVEVYISSTAKRSNQLAHLFLIGTHQTIGFKSRGVKYGNFQVLRETARRPSVLLELGFLSNREEAAYFLKESSISALALMILETLVKFLQHDRNFENLDRPFKADLD